MKSSCIANRRSRSRTAQPPRHANSAQLLPPAVPSRRSAHEFAFRLTNHQFPLASHVISNRHGPRLEIAVTTRNFNYMHFSNQRPDAHFEHAKSRNSASPLRSSRTGHARPQRRSETSRRSSARLRSSSVKILSATVAKSKFRVSCRPERRKQFSNRNTESNLHFGAGRSSSRRPPHLRPHPLPFPPLSRYRVGTFPHLGAYGVTGKVPSGPGALS